jgi:release factor glutamine methyltransferase
MGLDFETSSDVLIPREETQLLAKTALDLLDGTRVIDMCCGAGNLACTIAHRRADARVWASDLTDACVGLARRNVERHGLADRVEVRQGDLFGALDDLEGTIDLVVCNPPYISTGRLAKESAHLLEGQPREAFDAGPFGVTIHTRVIKEAPRFLRPGGWLAVEIGAGQERQIELLFGRAGGFEPTQKHADASGAIRVLAARRKVG